MCHMCRSDLIASSSQGVTTAVAYMRYMAGGVKAFSHRSFCAAKSGEAHARYVMG